MTNRLHFKATCAFVLLFFFASGTAFAFDDGFSRSARLEGKHFFIYYAPGIDLSALIQKLNVRPSDRLLAGNSADKAPSFEGELAGMLDTLFTQVCGVLDMQLYSFKGTIKICRDSAQLNNIYWEIFNKEPEKTTRSFYAYSINTIYTSADNFRIGIIGHEIAHAVISNYFVILPSTKIQEVLAAYVEYQLRNSGQ
jgi:hypothetical protein